VKQLRREVQDLKALVQSLQKRLDQLAPAPAAPTPSVPVTPLTEPEGVPPPPVESEPGEEGAPPAPEAPGTGAGPASGGGGGRSLLLPDISLIGTFIGHLSSDRRDTLRNRLILGEAELGVQSYVYPGIKADAFITMPFESGHTAAVEEAYLTVQQIGKLPLSARLGKSKVPFGRTNQLHPHSYPYIVKPAPLSNLVAPESLTGQGGYFSYLVPTGGKLFLQLDAGVWNNPDPVGTVGVAPVGVPQGSGAAFADRFSTARLWSSLPMAGNGELDFGLSHAWGRGQSYQLPADSGVFDRPRVRLFGADFSYRRFGTANRRLLLRGEYVSHHHSSPLDRGTADGWYLLADQRFSSFSGVGLMWDHSGYPYAPGLRTNSVSAIFTRQLTEQTYLRAQLIHGDRPGKRGFSELWFQWVWGVGPHTHNLE
jgi:hypothetical protein